MYAIPRPTFSERGLLFVGMMGGMPATIARMLMCFGVFTGAVIIYLVVFISLERSLGDEVALMYAGAVSCVLFALAWFLVWRKMVQWTAKRIGWTFGVVMFSFVTAGLLCVFFELITRHWAEELGIFLGSLGWAMTWLIGTSIVWRENARERGERLRRLGIHAVACPDCGYNLTGLKEAKCPECGAVYTLDQLYASIAEQRAELGGD